VQSRVLESLVAVIGVQVVAAIAVATLHRSDAWLRRALPYVISVAVGVLLSTGVAHLLPEAVEALGNHSAVWITLILTMLSLYSFERIFMLLSRPPCCSELSPTASSTGPALPPPSP
jgi:zinc transporter ZupT